MYILIILYQVEDEQCTLPVIDAYRANARTGKWEYFLSKMSDLMIEVSFAVILVGEVLGHEL